MCTQAGGNPPPRIVFWVGGADEEVEPDSRLGDTARLAVRLEVAATITCTAENSGTARPLVSNRVHINIRSEFFAYSGLVEQQYKNYTFFKDQ